MTAFKLAKKFRDLDQGMTTKFRLSYEALATSISQVQYLLQLTCAIGQGQGQIRALDPG